jgi:excisionase family DNA binding protein
VSARQACGVLTLAQAAEVLGIAPETARRLAASGELAGAIRVGRHWRVSIPALERALGAPEGFVLSALALPSSDGDPDGTDRVDTDGGSGGAGTPSESKPKRRGRPAPPNPPKRRLRKAG